MASISDTIKTKFKYGSMTMKLIYINIGMFLLLHIFMILGLFVGLDSFDITQWVKLPADIHSLLIMPWTIVTYMFAHTDFFHILFNMLWLYWFGNIFLFTSTPKQMVALYLLGGIGGAVAYLLLYNFHPLFSQINGTLIGASASVIAIVIATAILHPEYKMNILFIGEVSLKWIAVFTIIISAIGLTGSNAGGQIAHIGGAAIGALYGFMMKRGIDITRGINTLIDNMVNMWRKTTTRAKNGSKTNTYHRDNTARDTADYASMDEILDKIKRSGYTSLTAAEKKKLFEESRRIK